MDVTAWEDNIWKINIEEFAINLFFFEIQNANEEGKSVSVAVNDKCSRMRFTWPYYVNWVQ